MKLFDFLKTDSGWIGIVLGIIGPFLGFYIYYQLMFADVISMKGFIDFVHTPETLSKIISLSVLMNGIIFFVLLHFKKDLAARAVLGMTLVYGGIIAYLKFFA